MITTKNLWILPAIQHPPVVIGGLCGDKLYLSIDRVPRLQDGCWTTLTLKPNISSNIFTCIHENISKLKKSI